MNKITYHAEYCHGTPHEDSNWRAWSNPTSVRLRANSDLQRAQAANPDKTFRLVKTTWIPTEEIVPQD